MKHSTDFFTMLRHFLAVALLAAGAFSVRAASAQPSAVIIRFADAERAVFLRNDAVLRDAAPVFPELHRKGAVALLSAASPALDALRRYAQIRVPADENPSVFLRKIRAAAGVEYAGFVQKSRIQQQISNDSLVGRQWAPARLRAAGAWKTSTGAGVVVGVLDTGADFFHPDLSGQFAVNAAEDANRNGTFEPWPAAETRNGIRGDLDGRDDDGNGFIDDVIGYDFVDQFVANVGDYAGRDAIPADEHGHGTSVSGIIAARANNRIGIAGIAPDAKIKVLRCHDATGNAEEDDIAAAIVYAAMNGVRVLNMSFGDVVNSPLTRDALAFAASRGCVLVASAGNDGSELRRFPASYPGVIAVGATTEADRRAPFSSFGSHLAISAPGVNILTTAAGGRYRPFQGTSAAAPHVAAAAALLLAVRPDLSPAEVRGMLQATAEDLGAKGWDESFGAGIPDCEAAVNAVGRTLVQIEDPQNDAVLTGNIAVRGTILTPLLESWALEVAVGENPTKNWVEIAAGKTAQSRFSALGELNAAALADTTYTLRLAVRLKNGNTLEHRVRLDVARSPAAPEILAAEAISVWRDDLRTVLLTVKTARRTLCLVKNPQTGAMFYDRERYGRTHEFLLTPAQAGGAAEIVCYAPGGADSSRRQIAVPAVSEAFPTGGFNSKPYSAPPAQLTGYVRDFYRDGKPAIVINDISSGDFGDTKTLQFDAGKFVEKHKMTEKWIPRGMGDSNGDGVMEVLAHSFAEARVFQGKTAGDSPFSDTLFSERTVNFAGRKDFFAAGMFDLDGDGREEIFGFCDTACLVYKFSGGKYELLAVAPNDSPRGEYGSPNTMRPPVCSVGDFDGDGYHELFYGDTDGDFLIFEYANGKFTREFLLENRGEGGTEYCTPVDVDGDGVKELLAGFYAPLQFNADREYEPSVWTYKLMKSVAPNRYEVVWQDTFYGVRAGTFYGNGVAAGDLDGRGGEEIVLLPFPNVYVMRWDAAASTFHPVWYAPFQYSNTALVYDFDGNGMKELGYCDGGRTVFAEYTRDGTGPGVPAGFSGYAKDARTAALRWSPAPFATEYQVYVMRNPTETTTSAELIAVTTDTALTLDTLTPNTLYRFYLRGRRLGAVQPDGAFALPVEVFTHDPMKPVSAAWSDGVVFVKFSAGYLPFRPVSEQIFTLKTGAIRRVPSGVFGVGDSTFALRFDAPVPDGVWQLDAAPFDDRYGTPTLAASLNVTVSNAVPVEEMILLRLDADNPRTLRLRYSAPVNEPAATDVFNYELRPSGAIQFIEKAGDSTVILRLSDDLPPVGEEYTLTVRNVASAAGAPITKGAGNTLGFIIFGAEEGAYCHPNPFRQSVDDELTFAGLPRDATVTVYTLDMKPLATLRDTRGAGGVHWRPADAAGQPLATGVYLFRATGKTAAGADVETGLVKFGIIR